MSVSFELSIPKIGVLKRGGEDAERGFQRIPCGEAGFFKDNNDGGYGSIPSGNSSAGFREGNEAGELRKQKEIASVGRLSKGLR